MWMRNIRRKEGEEEELIYTITVTYYAPLPPSGFIQNCRKIVLFVCLNKQQGKCVYRYLQAVCFETL